MKAHQKLAEHFKYLHNNPPPPFNKDYDPNWRHYSRKATESMEADGYYDNHSREECAVEWRKRYDEAKTKC